MAIRTTSVTTVYPMDSQVTSVGADGLPVYDRPYNASDLREVMSLYATDGVCADRGEELAVSARAGSWYVGTGACVAHGLLVPVAAEARVFDQSDLRSGQYAYVIVAGRFDSQYRDGAVYARVASTPSYSPLRTDSTWELVLARVDWRGNLTDLRMDPAYCGAMAPVLPVDTESFVSSLKTKLSEFGVVVGEVETLPAGVGATVARREPEAAGDPVTLDFGIPAGLPGAPGSSAAHVGPDEPAREAGALWLHEPEGSRVIDDIRTWSPDPLWPGESTFPGPDTWPGGGGEWVSHRLAQSLVGGAS